MIDLRQTIDIKEALNMRVQVSVDDRVVIDKKADSLVGNFVRLLHANAGANISDGGYFDNNDNRSTPKQRRSVLQGYSLKRYGNNAPIGDLVIVDKNPPAHINVNPDGNSDGVSLDGAVNGLVDIWTRDSDFSGLYAASSTADGNSRDDFTSYDLYLWEVDNIDPETNEVTIGNQVDLTGVDLSNFNGDATIQSFQENFVRADDRLFGNPQIYLGADYQNVPIGVADQTIYQNIKPLFDAAGTSVAAPAISTNSAEIEFSETFSNNYGSDLDINSVGIAGNDESNSSILIARDPASFTIPDGSSVTVTYFFTVSNSGSGGVMAQFAELLYRQISRNYRELPDIFNSNINNNRSAWNFRMVGPGGDSRYGRLESDHLPGRNIGPVVGTSTVSVSNTDFGLQDIVPHGQSEDNKLFHYGSVVEDFQLDDANNKAYFDVSRLFENRGSVNIDINETGVYAASSGQDFDSPDSSHLIARHTLGTTQTLSAGEILKLTYRFEVNV